MVARANPPPPSDKAMRDFSLFLVTPGHSADERGEDAKGGREHHEARPHAGTILSFSLSQIVRAPDFATV